MVKNITKSMQEKNLFMLITEWVETNGIVQQKENIF